MTEMLQAELDDWFRRTCGNDPVESGGADVVHWLVELAERIREAQSEIGDPTAPWNQSPLARRRVARLHHAKALFAELYVGATGATAREHHVDANGGEEPIPLPAMRSRLIAPYVDLRSISVSSFEPLKSNDDPMARLTQHVLEQEEAFQQALLTHPEMTAGDQQEWLDELLGLAHEGGGAESREQQLFAGIANALRGAVVASAKSRQQQTQRQVGAMLWRGLGYKSSSDSSATLEDVEAVRELGREFMMRTAALAQSFRRGALLYTPVSLCNSVRADIVACRDSRGTPTVEHAVTQSTAFRHHRTKSFRGTPALTAVNAVLGPLSAEIARQPGKSDDAYAALKHVQTACLHWLEERRRINLFRDDPEERDTALYGRQRLASMRASLLAALTALVESCDGDPSSFDLEALLPEDATVLTEAFAADHALQETWAAVNQFRYRAGDAQTLVDSTRDAMTAMEVLMRRVFRSTPPQTLEQWSHAPVLGNNHEVRVVGGWSGSRKRHLGGTEFVQDYETKMDLIERHASLAMFRVGGHMNTRLLRWIGGKLEREELSPMPIHPNAVQNISQMIKDHPLGDRQEMAAHVLEDVMTRALGSGMKEGVHQGIRQFCRRHDASPFETLTDQWVQVHERDFRGHIGSRPWAALRDAASAVKALRDEVRRAGGFVEPGKVDDLAWCTKQLREAFRFSFHEISDSAMFDFELDELVPDVDDNLPFAGLLTEGSLRSSLDVSWTEIPLSELPGLAVGVHREAEELSHSLLDDVSDARRAVHVALATVAGVQQELMHQGLKKRFWPLLDDTSPLVTTMASALAADDRGLRAQNPKRALLLALRKHASYAATSLEDFRRTSEVQQVIVVMPTLEPREFTPSFFGELQESEPHPFALSTDAPDATEYLRRAEHWIDQEERRFQAMLHRDERDLVAQTGKRQIAVLRDELSAVRDELRHQGETLSSSLPSMNSGVEGFAQYLRDWGRSHDGVMRNTEHRIRQVMANAGEDRALPDLSEADERFGRSANATPLDYVRLVLQCARRDDPQKRCQAVAEWLEEALMHGRTFDLSSPHSATGASPPPKGAIGTDLYQSIVGDGLGVADALAVTATRWKLVEKEPVGAPADRLVHHLRSTRPPFLGPDFDDPGASWGIGDPGDADPFGPSANGRALDLPADDAFDETGSCLDDLTDVVGERDRTDGIESELDDDVEGVGIGAQDRRSSEKQVSLTDDELAAPKTGDGEAVIDLDPAKGLETKPSKRLRGPGL